MKMEPDNRCLTDLLVLELEPGLTPLMGRIGFVRAKPEELSATDSWFFHERDQKLLGKHEDFRSKEDVLVYEHELHKMLLLIRKNPRRGAYNSTSPAFRPFSLNFRYDFGENPEISASKYSQMLPQTKAVGGLCVKLQKTFHAEAELFAADLERDFYLGLNDELTIPRFRDFWRDFEGMPPDVRPYQFYFTFWLRYSLKLDEQVLEGKAKDEALEKIPPIITVFAHMTRLYIEGQARLYDVQRLSVQREMSLEALSEAAFLPVTGKETLLPYDSVSFRNV